MRGRGPASLNELLGSGKSAPKEISLDNLGEVLGEKMPEIQFSPVGRMRLMTALRNRFGDGFRNIPGISKVIKEFDHHADFNVKLMQMKEIKGRR